MTPDNNKEDSKWYIFLRNGQTATRIGSSENPKRGTSLKFSGADNLTSNMSVYFTTSDETPTGPNQFFICRFFASLFDRGLIASEIVAGLMMQAAYSNEEFKAEGEFFSGIDIKHLIQWGENELRAVGYQNNFVSELQEL
ncbi:hypothetical protein BDV19DRAFT_390475 [Aspergillus venezuelensis]